MSSILEGASNLLDPVMLLAIVAAVIFAQIVAVIPGLGGAFLLAVLIPFTFGMDPMIAIAILIAASATDGSGNSVTSILFGVPGSATAAASLFDGHPMARNGQAGRAIGAAMTGSAVGGIIGALTLAIAIPIARPFVLAFGTTEFFVLVILALFSLAHVREEALLKGLVSAGLGLSLSFVGMEGATGVQRYTHGQLYLWDGLRLVPVLLGLFAVAEAFRLLATARASRGHTPSRHLMPVERMSGVGEGVKDVFRHFDATWLSSWTGLIIGMLPGVGGAAGQFMAYSAVAKSSQARKRTRDLPPFGKGNVRGVIAADSSTNATLGGELVPVLAFGIPGSSTMAIVLAALVTFGIQPGPRMLELNLDVVWMIVLVLVIGNLIATSFVLSFARQLAKLVHVRASLLGPAILAVSFFGAYATTRHVGDIYTAALAGLLGFFLARYGYGRVSFLIGFVLGPILEHYFILALQIYGPGFLFARPFTMVLLAILVLGIAWSAAKSIRARRERTQQERLA